MADAEMKYEYTPPTVEELLEGEKVEVLSALLSEDISMDRVTVDWLSDLIPVVSTHTQIRSEFLLHDQTECFRRQRTSPNNFLHNYIGAARERGYHRCGQLVWIQRSRARHLERCPRINTRYFPKAPLPHCTMQHRSHEVELLSAQEAIGPC